MLGNIALGGTDQFDDILDAALLVAKHAQYLQPQGMRHRLERPRRLFNMFVAFDKF
jgi:hypothetical protein